MDPKEFFPPEEVEAYLKGRHGEKMGFGVCPAIIVVDLTYAFVDPAQELTGGRSGWPAVQANARLLEKARAKSLPIIYTKPSEHTRTHPVMGSVSRKRVKAIREYLARPGSNDIVSEIAPHPEDYVITKTAGSGFFGTDLIKILIYYRVDTVIVTGASTSGCVRATVVDAASYNYRAIVPAECVADRSDLSHRVSLFEMEMKYADVVGLGEVLEYIAGLPQRPWES